MTRLVWWHLSGLCAGATQATVPLQTVRDALLSELRDPPAALPTPHLLLIAGDLAANGRPEEFTQVFEIIDKISEACAERGGDKPLLFFVPGPRDLKPPGDDPSYDWFCDYDRDRYAARREALWGQDQKNEHLQKIEVVFNSYSHFFEQRCLQQFQTVAQRRRGWMPGDALASVEVGGLKLGLVGLNSAWRCCGGRESDLTVDPGQLHRLLKEDHDWEQAHDLCLLLQRHAPKCLEEKSFKQ
jgi:hypothetical protein